MFLLLLAICAAAPMRYLLSTWVSEGSLSEEQSGQIYIVSYGQKEEICSRMSAFRLFGRQEIF